MTELPTRSVVVTKLDLQEIPPNKIQLAAHRHRIVGDKQDSLPPVMFSMTLEQAEAIATDMLAAVQRMREVAGSPTE